MTQSFDQQLERLRAGDPTVVHQFVDEYEPLIRRAFRAKLTQADLRSAADSTDLCQSVLGSFLVHLMGGKFQITSATDLKRLLLTFARRKFTAMARKEFAVRRDRRRLRQLRSDSNFIDPQATPEETAQERDLIEEVSRRLSDAERELLKLRQSGLEWESIGLQLNVSPELLRKRLSRALNRVAVELGEDSQDA